MPAGRSVDIGGSNPVHFGWAVKQLHYPNTAVHTVTAAWPYTQRLYTEMRDGSLPVHISATESTTS
jgi:hypothetical protein